MGPALPSLGPGRLCRAAQPHAQDVHPHATAHRQRAGHGERECSRVELRPATSRGFLRAASRGAARAKGRLCFREGLREDRGALRVTPGASFISGEGSPPPFLPSPPPGRPSPDPPSAPVLLLQPRLAGMLPPLPLPHPGPASSPRATFCPSLVLRDSGSPSSPRSGAAGKYFWCV